jgi:phosphodiesterase/alkaline phosphatase D-like protein
VTVTSAAGTPLTVSNITALSITQNSAVITWTTNVSADSLVEYGTSSAYGSTSLPPGTGSVINRAINHSVNLTSLLPSTTYHYRVKSTDASGNTATSTDNTFVTTLRKLVPVAPLMTN